MRRNFKAVVLGWVGLALLGLAVVANAVEISEYFNGYGSANTFFYGTTTSGPALNGGTGWASSYNTYNGGDPNAWTRYSPGDSVNPAVTGYSAPQNLNGASDGTARQLGVSGGSNAAWYAYRATGPLTGTIWITSAFRVGNDNNNTAVFYSLDSNSSSSTNNAVALCASVYDGPGGNHRSASSMAARKRT